MPDLAGKVCLVTGASRGIGKGIALQLAKAGAFVYITGRTLNTADNVPGSLKQTFDEIEASGGKCRALQCDHSKDEDVQKLFDTIKTEQNGKLDVLVNNAFSAVKTLTKYSKVPYWKTPIEIWDDVNCVGLRNHYVCTVLATQLMIERGSGLIVNISSAGGLRYLFNVAYGVGKCAVDRMAADCALEVKKHGVTIVSLWPGAVRTENIEEALKSDTPLDPSADLSEDDKAALEKQKQGMKKLFDQGAESTQYAGLAIAHLAADEKHKEKTGKILLTSDLAVEYGFKDVDGSVPYNLRSVGALLSLGGYRVGGWIPGWVKVPRWALHLASNKF